MKLTTKYFGEIECDETKVIEFDEGILGFDELKRFIILTMSDDGDESLIYWMQSIDEPQISFSLMNVFPIVKNYHEALMADDVISEFDINHDIMVYNTIVIPDGEIEKARVNLKSPIIVNMHTKKGKQIILSNDSLNIRYSIFNELKNSESR